MEKETKSNVLNFEDIKQNKVKKQSAEKMLKAVEKHQDRFKEKPIGSEPITINDLEEEIEDAFCMGKQEAVYQTVATFLHTPEAIRFNITGVRIAIEDGYINCYWEFGERGVPTDGK